LNLAWLFYHASRFFATMTSNNVTHDGQGVGARLGGGHELLVLFSPNGPDIALEAEIWSQSLS
jgi:hypothetical protein